jgi:hypothetical protein
LTQVLKGNGLSTRELSINLPLDSEIQELINKDDIWEALLMIVKQHRGKTCASANLLTESLNYDDNMTALLNPGNYFFDQYQRMHEIQKAMTALNNGVTV